MKRDYQTKHAITLGIIILFLTSPYAHGITSYELAKPFFDFIEKNDVPALQQKIETDAFDKPSTDYHPLQELFHTALAHEKQEIIKLCAQHLDASIINQRDPETGYTALHKCAVMGNDEASQILIAKGANPFLRDQNGKTALDIARQHKTIESIPSLISYHRQQNELRGINLILSLQEKFPHVLYPDALKMVVQAVKENS